MVQKIETVPKLAPRIATVAVQDHRILRITWKAGVRVGRTDVVDLSPIIYASKLFRPLREDHDLFQTVHAVAGGVAIAWGDDEEIDLSAIALQNLAEETLTSTDMKKLIDDYGMTEASLAATLGYSRRQVVSFVNDEAPIPRVASLACLYIALKHPLAEKDELKIQPSAQRADLSNTGSSSVPWTSPRAAFADKSKLNYIASYHA